ncbi:site-specific integrase [Heyndrickxia sporothermodurans]|uniref:site-specific integrase n=1 Tax=Heyndrickxia sporothermodurans TaxID=46224 RepID=UPI002DB6FFA2|nr:site-specific integrase [Heyndrickxia sporothermodurans]MEB6549300.1 site-specific integrase [Heyndrickxia sporothermodurans]
MASFKRYKTNSGYRWSVQVSIGKDPMTGRYRYTTRRGFKRKQDAEDAAREILNQVDEGEFIKNEYVTFEEVYEKWIEEQGRRLKISTMMSKKSKFTKYILPNFGKLFIDQITTKDCQDFIDKLATHMKSFRDYGNQLDLVFRYAKRKKLLRENPMDELVYPPYVDEYSSPEEDQGVEFWERETVNYFLERAEQEFSFRVFAMFRTLLYTGIRKGELAALLETDLCEEKKELHINKNLVRVDNQHLLLRPKTKNSIRTITLDDETFEILVKLKKLNERLREEHGNPDIEKFLFPRPSDLKPMRLAHPNERLNYACKKFKVKNIKVHGLRHTHASMLFASGARMKDIQQRLGHARISTTMDIYTHITEDTDGNLSKLLASYLNKETAPNREDNEV